MSAAVMDKDFKLVTPDHVVKASEGDDVTLPCHLSPKTSAVAMEIRWFNGTHCIYLYKNGHVTEGRDYEGRVSVNTQELQRGDVSLTLRNIRWGDEGVYTCQVISGEHKEEGRVGLRCSPDYMVDYLDYMVGAVDKNT
ncbi:myelin-oligodendrocyte glycoprotein-like [Clupea harengus]|uniref:Myelin-oligodendrocyte glycoprotein-like n=1 Tax=Clupea harengus TaxID=7950 RepID=A0A8M1K5H4_CLUHA|nr:myelin-oligodendrocyte glycoprotein-like [Clupea harengus]